ncbi:putative transcription factor GRAS family [Rosa chinensis]|uniref:Putative transcription factor GRAS family n=1 Tax=Rosa chinensis TaxID=74649 RepID=A0A2P6PV51_ROSCH|nr:protein SCARECROW 1 [Rosa chinensis]PRQ25807.1 putative transcription factor GRAS family [Rosa chinensis]
MKAEFEMVHGTVNMIQPHETNWINNSTSVNPFPKPVSDLSQWVEHITKQLIDDLPETATTTADTLHTAATSGDQYFIPPSHSGEFSPRKAPRKNYGDDTSADRADYDLQWGNELQLHAENNRRDRGLSKLDQHGLTLITLLFECAVAISVENPGEAHRMLLELTQMASPYGPSCAERVVAYFAKAMSSRVLNSWLGICSPLVNYKSIHGAFQVFNTISPFIKFAHFTSNQAILEAFHRRDRVHIIDLDIMQGLQWPALFHILATRMEGPPHVRMTGFGASSEVLLETGKQLSNFARRLGLSFEFHPITRKFGDHLDTSMVQVRRGETVAVHWLQHSLYDATGPDWRTMKLIEELSPRIVTLVEQDMSHNGGSFLDRFVGSLHYYSTMFDSLEAYLPSDNPNRHLVEHSLMYREINNILAVGGPARSGEDKFRHWRSELGASNSFMQVGMSGNSMAQAQLILNMFPPSNGYNLVQGDGTIRLGWKDTSLYVASAWTCSHASSR